MEGRILANLHAQPTVENRSWWRWGVTVALALVLLTLGLAWKATRTPRPLIVERPASSHPATDVPHTSAKQIAPEVAGNRSVPERGIHKHKNPALSTVTIVASDPKREQFPSPQPLSEQEQLLASYVASDPHHAVLIARAQTELERRDHEEEMRELGAETSQDSEQTRH